MAEKFSITIARQCGSHGRSVAKKIAEKLGIDYYDKELISLASKKSGINEKVFENFDEKPTNSLLYSLAMGAYAMDGQYVYWGDSAVPLSDKVYNIQSDLIRSLAAEKSCVFLGRCADYALRDDPRSLHVLVTDLLPTRVANYMAENNVIDAKKAEDAVLKIDKKRANYYSFHTNRSWSSADSFDLCVRTSVLGIDGTADMIIAYAEKKFGKLN
ncbi:MAG: cytidylate kinase-like family protein [Ruminococcaceae bacterium]|nr:cytidylate kinase-like family protein [Oscillospiraceae bacterium]